MLPEFRKDPLSGRWVIVAPGRAIRPQDVEAVVDEAKASRACPFCPGDEADTPSEVLAVRDAGQTANSAGWRVRVVPNKFPAVCNEPDGWDSAQVGYGAPSVRTVLPGRGVHEVIIESPRHLHSNTQQTPGELCEVLWAYRERLRAVAATGEWRYGVFFKNVGYAAGALLEHLHSQFVALPIVPAAIEETLLATSQYREQHGVCYYCDLLRRELAERVRVVAENADFAAVCPFAGRFAFETWIIARRHSAHYNGVLDGELPGLAEILLTALRKLEMALDKPAYNFAIRTAPFDTRSDEHYHWHIEIFPRITRLAGFELSTDFYINVVRPEDAAARLRMS